MWSLWYTTRGCGLFCGFVCIFASQLWKNFLIIKSAAKPNRLLPKGRLLLYFTWREACNPHHLLQNITFTSLCFYVTNWQRLGKPINTQSENLWGLESKAENPGMYGLTSVKCELQQFSLCDVKLSVGSKSTCIFTVSLPLASRAVSSSFNGRQHYGEYLIVKTLALIMMKAYLH